jgi:tetratricopeptide (TPR) repeat protein
MDREPAMTNASPPPKQPTTVGKSPWFAVLALWLLLFSGVGISLVIIRSYAVDFLSRVESEAAGPILASQLLQEQGWKHGRRVLAALDRGEAKGRLSASVLAELEAAESCFDRALKIDPRTEFDGAWAATYALLSSLAEIQPRPGRLQAMQAAAELTAGRPQTATEIASDLLATPDNFPPAGSRALWVLMEIAYRDKQSTEIRRIASLLEEKVPEDLAVAEIYRAEAAIIDKDAGQAAIHFEKALQLGARKEPELRYRLAETYSFLDRKSDATRILAEGLNKQTYRDPTFLHRTGIFLIAEQRPKEAYKILEIARLLAPGNADILWTQSRAAERAKMDRRAARLMQQALQIDPSLIRKVQDDWP